MLNIAKCNGIAKCNVQWHCEVQWHLHSEYWGPTTDLASLKIFKVVISEQLVIPVHFPFRSRVGSLGSSDRMALLGFCWGFQWIMRKEYVRGSQSKLFLVLVTVLLQCCTGLKNWCIVSVACLSKSLIHVLKSYIEIYCCCIIVLFLYLQKICIGSPSLRHISLAVNFCVIFRFYFLVLIMLKLSRPLGCRRASFAEFFFAESDFEEKIASYNWK